MCREENRRSKTKKDAVAARATLGVCQRIEKGGGGRVAGDVGRLTR